MDLIVCMKQTPDTAAVINIKEGCLSIDTDGVDYVINPYDEFAIEEALRIKERFGGTVTVISLGPERVKKALRTSLAMGADRAVHLLTDIEELSSNYIAAEALAEHIKTLPFEIILCGKQAVDNDSSQVGQMVAEFLGIPHIGAVVKLSIDDEKRDVTANMEQEGGNFVVKSQLPVLLTCQKGLNEPRLPSLKGIMTAKRKEIDVISLGSDKAASKKLKIKELCEPPKRQGGMIINEKTPEDSVKKLVDLLRNESKVL